MKEKYHFQVTLRCNLFRLYIKQGTKVSGYKDKRKANFSAKTQNPIHRNGNGKKVKLKEVTVDKANTKFDTQKGTSMVQTRHTHDIQAFDAIC